MLKNRFVAAFGRKPQITFGTAEARTALNRKESAASRKQRNGTTDSTDKEESSTQSRQGAKTQRRNPDSESGAPLRLRAFALNPPTRDPSRSPTECWSDGLPDPAIFPTLHHSITPASIPAFRFCLSLCLIIHWQL
jgi:hypothetical protein